MLIAASTVVQVWMRHPSDGSSKVPVVKCEGIHTALLEHDLLDSRTMEPRVGHYEVSPQKVSCDSRFGSVLASKTDEFENE
jgi:hypothetical protein